MSQASEFVPKILEIGNIPLMWAAYPQTTEFYSTWYDEKLVDPARGRHIVSLANLPRLARRLADPAFDLVVVHASPYAPWSPRALWRTLFRRSVLAGSFPFVRGFGPELLRGRVAAPVAVVDLDDPAVIDRANKFLLDRARVYFKRELPPDYWRLFAGTLHWRLPTPRFRARARNRARIAKVRPISLGVPFSVLEWAAARPVAAAEKTIDVFFAGRIENSSTVRERGLAELLALRAEGYTIEVPEEALSLDAYLERCARAWIVWTPEGYGWQSFRTYEAAVCGAVSLSNRPMIERYRPLIEGEHALYYDSEAGGLARAVRAALADRDRLIALAAAARAHVLAHHTPAAIARYVVETTLKTQ
jgi:hypothetical protein